MTETLISIGIYQIIIKFPDPALDHWSLPAVLSRENIGTPLRSMNISEHSFVFMLFLCPLPYKLSLSE